MAGNWNSGRRPIPSRLHVLRGQRVPKVRADEPKIPAVTDAFDIPPAELKGNPIAVGEWVRLVPMLRVCGIVTNAERPALIALCTEWAQWMEAQTQIRTLGMLIKGKDGTPMRNPFIRIANDSLKQCQRLWVELGLTPSSRSKLHVPEASSSQPVSKWANDL